MLHSVQRYQAGSVPVGVVVVIVILTTIGAFGLSNISSDVKKIKNDQISAIENIQEEIRTINVSELFKNTDAIRVEGVEGPQGLVGPKGDTGAAGSSSGDITSVNSGSGLSGGAVSGDVTLAFGALASDWAQSGAFDIVLGNASSEIKILESIGDTYYASIDAGDLTSDAIFSFMGSTGNILTSTNYTTSLNSVYQAFDAQLSDVAGLTPTDNVFIVGNSTNFVGESGATARTSMGLGSISTQDANSVSITGGTIAGITSYDQASGNFSISGTGTFGTGTGVISLNGNTTIASTKVLAVTTADDLTVGGNIIPQTLFINADLTGVLLDKTVFVADTTYKLTSAKCIYSVAALTNGTLQITVDTSTGAPASGTAQLTGTINLSTTVNTAYSGTLIASPTTINAGDRVSVDFGGTLTNLLGTCTIGLKRV